MHLKKMIVISYIFLASQIAFADNVAQPKMFEITGQITKKYLENFDQALAADPEIKGILLSNSLGAANDGVESVEEFRKRIDQKKLSTFERGICASACANIFLLGYQRNLLANPNGKPSTLLLHPVRRVFEVNKNGVGQVQVFFTDKINQQISERSQGKLTIELLNKMYDAEDGSGGIFILRDPNSEGKYILFSKSLAKKIRATPISELTPADLGITIAEE